jgi:hypothetical protein
VDDLAERIVDAMHAIHGRHPGFRAAHAKGSCCLGTFVASAEAASLCIAPHFQGEEVSVTVPSRTARVAQIGPTALATNAEAQRRLRDLLPAVDRGEFVQPSKATVREHLTSWLPTIRTTVRPSTYRSYAGHVEHHLSPAIGKARLQPLDSERLNALYADLLERGLAPATVRRIHATLSRALKDAVRWKRLVRNPAADADPPTVSPPRRRCGPARRRHRP